MTFRKLSEYFSQLEATTLRNKMVEILANLFQKAKSNEIGNLCYLLQGRVAPLFEAIEFGVADKMVIRAVALGLGVDATKVGKEFKKAGDLGTATEKLKVKSSLDKTRDKQKLKEKAVSILNVFDVLYKVATSGGKGSQEEKIKLLGSLLRDVDSLSARYIVRITLAKLRLGFSDMTILDSLSWMLKGTKELRPTIEKAYNVRPDLGYISERIKENGIEGLTHITPKVGTPILMAKADRLKDAGEILEKISKCAIEFKYDGLRLQVHRKKDFVKLFSRNLEDLTPMFPDIVDAVLKNVVSDEVILEGEVVAYNPKTGVSIAFQKTMQRRRIYDIEAKTVEIPVKLYAFELLYISGKNLIEKPYRERKAILKKIIRQDKVLNYATESIVDTESEIERLFDASVNLGFEGIIAKRLDGVYQAGMRGFNWIKFKRAMSQKLMDTFDVLVMGYTLGEGKRTNFGIGEFLTGVYDKKTDQFVTLAKIGTGLTDEQFRELKKRVKSLEVKNKPVSYNVDKLLEVDVWLKPSLVVEVSADEITLSQVHSSGRVMGPSKSGKAEEVKVPGYSLRFPRLERFRDDKRVGDVTTLSEIVSMFKAQGKAKT